MAYGPPELSGALHPAVASAMAAVAQTPQFHALVRQHQARMGAGGMHGGGGGGYQGDPTASQGGPGVAYGGGGVNVVDRPLRDIREFSLGFSQTAISTTGSTNVVSRPQVTFRGERLVCPSIASGGGSTVAAGFLINDIKVGNRSQLAAATTLPCQAFVETAVGVRLSLDTAAIAQDITLIVSNIQAAAATFLAILFGTIAQ